MSKNEIDRRVKAAVKHYWITRDKQSKDQGVISGVKDQGSRSAVTGGKHLDGFVELCKYILETAGLTEAEVFTRERKELPGYFRAEKSWDLLAISEGHVLAVIEIKAQAGPSFGNNINNRIEEALGNATDIWAAFREGAYRGSQRPWLGYLFLLEDSPRSNSSVKTKNAHFPVFPEFESASYAKRYEVFMLKLLRERLYDGSSMIMSSKDGGVLGKYSIPNEELSVLRFTSGLMAHIMAFKKVL